MSCHRQAASVSRVGRTHACKMPRNFVNGSVMWCIAFLWGNEPEQRRVNKYFRALYPAETWSEQVKRRMKWTSSRRILTVCKCRSSLCCLAGQDFFIKHLGLSTQDNPKVRFRKSDSKMLENIWLILWTVSEVKRFGREKPIRHLSSPCSALFSFFFKLLLA